MPLFARLIRSMYGTRQAALNWFVTFDSELTKLGFTRSKIEAGIYKREDVIILIWVDDIVLVGPVEQVNRAKNELKQRFNVKDLGPIKRGTFLGMRVVRDRQKRQIFLCQDAYIERILSRFGMARAHGVHTPIENGKKFHNRHDGEEAFDQQRYQEMVGAINYAAVATRGDLSFAIGLLGRYAADPTMDHAGGVKRILRYLRKTAGLRLCLGDQRGDRAFKGFRIYADADFAGDVDGMKSTSGMVIVDRFRSVIGWRSTKQTITAKSTADAEFIATAMAMENGWMYDLEREIHGESGNTRPPLSVFNDNEPCISNINRGDFQPPNRHIGVKYFWICDMVKLGEAQVEYISTHDMIADGFTKGLDRVKHNCFLLSLGLYENDDKDADG